MAIIQIPLHLRKLTTNQKQLFIANEKLIDSLNRFSMLYPALKPYLLDDNENLHPFVNLYVNGKDIRFLNNLQTVVTEDDVVTMILAIAGG